MSLTDRISSYFDRRARDWELSKGLQSVLNGAELKKFIASSASQGKIEVALPPCKNPLVAGFAAFGGLDADNGVGYLLSKQFVSSSNPYKALEAQLRAQGIAVEVVETEAPCFGRFRYAARVTLSLRHLGKNS